MLDGQELRGVFHPGGEEAAPTRHGHAALGVLLGEPLGLLPGLKRLLLNTTTEALHGGIYPLLLAFLAEALIGHDGVDAIPQCTALPIGCPPENTYPRAAVTILTKGVAIPQPFIGRLGLLPCGIYHRRLCHNSLLYFHWRRLGRFALRSFTNSARDLGFSLAMGLGTSGFLMRPMLCSPLRVAVRVAVQLVCS